MSFTQQVKDEILSNRQLKVKYKLAHAYGLMLFAKRFSDEQMSILTEHRAVADHYLDYMGDLIDIAGTITLKSYEGLNGKMVYQVGVDAQQDRKALMHIFCHCPTGSLCGNPLLDTQPAQSAFLAGAFLSCGNVPSPQKEYRLEFLLQQQPLAQKLGELLTELGFPPKWTTRRSYTVLYYKESEQIEDLLTLMSAPVSAMELMNVKIYKEVRNKVNRVSNCEVANIGKTVEAAAEQVAAIQRIHDTAKWEELPEELRQLAVLRIDNPDLSLRELGEMLVPKLSRSGVNHRLKRLMAIAETL